MSWRRFAMPRSWDLYCTQFLFFSTIAWLILYNCWIWSFQPLSDEWIQTHTRTEWAGLLLGRIGHNCLLIAILLACVCEIDTRYEHLLCTLLVVSHALCSLVGYALVLTLFKFDTKHAVHVSGDMPGLDSFLTSTSAVLWMVITVCFLAFCCMLSLYDACCASNDGRKLARDDPRATDMCRAVSSTPRTNAVSEAQPCLTQIPIPTPIPIPVHIVTVYPILPVTSPVAVHVVTVDPFVE